MRTNALYAALGGLLVLTLALGYVIYRDHQAKPGIQVSVGAGGISVEKK